MTCFKKARVFAFVKAKKADSSKIFCISKKDASVVLFYISIQTTAEQKTPWFLYDHRMNQADCILYTT